ncbi:hypothetical protein PIB30_057039, partial [Stylosanthes scabra]|nr:hypothetical protein [Stylosanthes scabra]
MIHQDITKLSKAHSSHVWPTSEMWPKRDPSATSPAVTFGPHLRRGPNVTSPYLFPSSLKQTWNKLDHASASSKSQAKPTLQALMFDPRFWGSKNVTSSLATP